MLAAAAVVPREPRMMIDGCGGALEKNRRSAHSTAVSSRVVRVTVGLERALVFAGNGVRSAESSANASVRVRMAVVCEGRVLIRAAARARPSVWHPCNGQACTHQTDGSNISREA